MNEEEARLRIIKWAENYFADDNKPCVKVVSIVFNADDEDWTAELEVSTSEDNPIVTFFERPAPHTGLQIVDIEY
jgi:hypothetical protein